MTVAGRRTLPRARAITAAVGLPVAVGTIGAVGVVFGGTLAGAATIRPGGGWTTPPVPVRPNGDLGAALLLFYGGLILLTRAFLVLRRRAHRGAVGRAGALATVAIWYLVVLAGPPMASRDAYSYVAQGAVVADGLDPYRDAPSALGEPAVAGVDPRWRDRPAPYGPVFLVLAGAVVGWTDADPVGSVLALRLLAVTGIAMMAVALPRLVGPGVDPVEALVLCVANPLTVLHLVSGAHNEALMVGFLLVGLVVGRSRRWWVPGVALCAVAASIKAPAILGVLHLGWCCATPVPPLQRVARTAAAGAIAFAVLAACGTWTGWGWGWVDTLLDGHSVLAYLSVTDIAAAFTDRPDVVRPVALALLAVTCAVVVLRSSGNDLRPLGWMLLAVAALGPGTQPWYLAWGTLVLALSARPLDRRVTVVATVLAAFAALPAGPDLGVHVLERLGVPGIGWAVMVLVPLTLGYRLLAVDEPPSALTLPLGRRRVAVHGWLGPVPTPAPSTR